MRRFLLLAAAALCLVALPAHAQTTADQKASILAALRLPKVTREARTLGIPDQDIKSVLSISREDRIPVGALTEAFEEQNKAVREHGPVDNFGAFVQEQLRSGLRGKELSAAIKAEHVAHGKGKGHLKKMQAQGAAHAEKAGDMAAEGKKKMKQMDDAEVQAKGAAKGAAKTADQAKGAAKGAAKSADQAKGKVGTKSGDHGG